MKFFPHEDYSTLSFILTQQVSDYIRELIKTKNKVTIVLCGGRTPIYFYEQLCKQPLEWEKVYFTTCDEHFDGNINSRKHEKIIRDKLLTNKAANAHFIPLTDLAPINFNLANHTSFFKNSIFEEIDILFLGLGIEGHTASIFPDAENIDDILTKNHDLFVINSKLSINKRITMGLQRIIAAKKIFFLLQGSDKLQILFDSLASGEETLIKTIAKNSSDVSVWWTFR